MEKGKIVRSRVDEVRPTGRDTSGVKFAAPDPGDAIIAVARNPERMLAEDELDEDALVDDDGTVEGNGAVPAEAAVGEGAVEAGAAERSEDAPESPDGVPSSVEQESDLDESDEPG
jgi:DNA gyrase subunit A